MECSIHLYDKQSEYKDVYPARYPFLDVVREEEKEKEERRERDESKKRGSETEQTSTTSSSSSYRPSPPPPPPPPTTTTTATTTTATTTTTTTTASRPPPPSFLNDSHERSNDSHERNSDSDSETDSISDGEYASGAALGNEYASGAAPEVLHRKTVSQSDEIPPKQGTVGGNAQGTDAVTCPTNLEKVCLAIVSRLGEDWEWNASWHRG